MNPAAAMGTFIRTWRAEWARMSRAQLANAVSALCKKRKRVTPFIVQEWEDGQPPKTTAELDGLCQVMARNGLIPPEIEDFRRLVFTACADRQYPELFTGEDLVHRADIADVAHAFYDPRREPNRYNAVHLVPMLKQLEHALADTSTSAAIRRAQQEALCVLLTAMAGWHDHCGRHAIAATAFAAVSGAVERFFGPGANLGGVPAITSLTMRCAMALARRADECNRLTGSPEWIVSAPVHPALQRRSAAILALTEEAAVVGDQPAADRAFAGGADPAWLGQPIHDEHERTLAELLDRGGYDGHLATMSHSLHRILRREGRFGEAERHVAGFECWREGDPTARCKWHDAMGELAFLQGNVTASVDHFVAGLEIARADHDAWHQRVFGRAIDACERAEKAQQSRSISVPRAARRREDPGPP